MAIKTLTFLKITLLRFLRFIIQFAMCGLIQLILIISLLERIPKIIFRKVVLVFVRVVIRICGTGGRGYGIDCGVCGLLDLLPRGGLRRHGVGFVEEVLFGS
jgi:hypothetical protein